MKIDKRMNLVLEVDRGDAPTVYVHHTPISHAAYRQHFDFLAKAMAVMYGDGFAMPSCTRIAYFTMLKMIEGEREAAASQPRPASAAPMPGRYDHIEQTLFAEMWRLTNIIVPGERGLETVPFYEAAKVLDEEDMDEVRNYLCFFTAASHVHSKRERAGMYEVLEASGAVITSLDCTEYSRSLQTSTQAASTGATPIPSSVPS